MGQELNNTPAFAAAAGECYEQGMNKRFYAACAVMQGLLANSGFYWQGSGLENLSGVTPELAANLAYQYADELLKQEGKDGQYSVGNVWG